jgi:deoxyribodipyrimidine photo-lyase
VSDAPSLVWFRLDLRLSDNPALTAAVDRGRKIIPLFILDDEDAENWAIGGASRWWLHQSLDSLTKDMKAAHGDLILRRGSAEQILDDIIAETGADAVYWNRRYEPWAIARDGKLKDSLKKRGIAVESFNGALLTEPWEMKTGQGGPYRVFTPYWKAVRTTGEIAAPLPTPQSLSCVSTAPKSDLLSDWDLLPTRPNWASAFPDTWTPGADGAAQRLSDFLDEHVFAYKDQRNDPGKPGTSRLSPHLHFGEISPRQIWHAAIAKSLAETGEPMSGGVMTFLSEVVWREFSYNLLYHFPKLPTDPLRGEFAAFPWLEDDEGLKAWQTGMTGYPIVDAGMRELWTTGWMHNRVRMITASFLIKDLMIHWSAGEAWFWNTLVDADLAANAASWQWVAGSGADAAPYFRIFNPILQGEKFDPDGTYVRQWVPELADLPDKVLHKPWEASPMELRAAGITLGESYPERIVDHGFARDRALAAYKGLKAA